MQPEHRVQSSEYRAVKIQKSISYNNGKLSGVKKAGRKQTELPVGTA